MAYATKNAVRSALNTERIHMTPAKKVQPFELAKCTAAILAVVGMMTLALTACSSDEPVTSGTVTDKNLDPAHTETYTEQVPDGQDCKYSSTKKKTVCKTDYDTVERTREVPDKYTLTLENCTREGEDDGKDCREGTVEVSEKVYNATEVGDTYSKPKDN